MGLVSMAPQVLLMASREVLPLKCAASQVSRWLPDSASQVLLVSMAAVPPMEWSLLQREVFSLLLPLHLSSNSPVSQAVLRRLWAGSPALVVEALVEYFAQDGGNLPRVLDICQDLQVGGTGTGMAHEDAWFLTGWCVWGCGWVWVGVGV